MSVKKTVKTQLIGKLNQASTQLKGLYNPPQGWLLSLRTALGMSMAEVAGRVGVSRSAIYQAEKQELSSSITLKQMQKLAQAMGGRFVYAVVPETTVESIIHQQAQKKAMALVRNASEHMALENQALTTEENKKRIDELTQELIREMPSDFWVNK